MWNAPVCAGRALMGVALMGVALMGGALMGGARPSGPAEAERPAGFPPWKIPP